MQANRNEVQASEQDGSESDWIAITRFTSHIPKYITKTIKLNSHGNLESRTPMQMSRGVADVLRFKKIEDLKEILPGLSPAQALGYGVPKKAGDSFALYSEATLPLERSASQIARTKENFRWPNGPGIFMLDYDPRDGFAALSKFELLESLYRAVPVLRESCHLWFPSASSCIWHADKQLAGVKGQRIYFVAKDAGDIERAGQILTKRLWLAGYGWYQVSRAGSLLERSIVDGSVWQTNRLDFAAGAKCEPPLCQKRDAPEIHGGEQMYLDTRQVLPDLSQEEIVELENIKKAAKVAAEPEAQSVRDKFIIDYALSKAKDDPESFQKFKLTAKHAVENLRLMGDFNLLLDDETSLSVGEVLDNREKYHGRLTYDPLEPDYGGHRPVGKLFLIGGRPRLYSFAHGGRTFQLVRILRRIESVPGRMSELVDRTLEVLRLSPDFFDYGDSIVVAQEGRIVPLTETTLSYFLGHEIQYWCWKKSPQGALYEVEIDPPAKMTKTIVEMGRRRALRALNGVITAPTIRADGSLLTKPGYDSSTRLLYDLTDKVPTVLTQPSASDLAEAISRLMHAFESFPFATTLDRSILLSALLTASIRQAIPTAPGFVFDAPIQGSGKTLLARCVGILSGGYEPTVWPHVSGGFDADAETRKRLLTVLIKGDPAFVWDNIVGVFDSPSIAALMTSQVFSDRMLGKSQDVTIPNRSLFLATGNNITLAKDLPRRFLVCRIDPNTDRPYARRFSIDPAQYCLENRNQMVVDALTIMRAWLSSSDRQNGWLAQGATASFEVWDSLVRQTVAWLAMKDPVAWCDPMDGFSAAVESDPEVQNLVTLLDGLEEEFSAGCFTSREVEQRIKLSQPPMGSNLSLAIDAIVNGKEINTRVIGRALTHYKDRQVGSRRLVSLGKTRTNVQAWRIRMV